MNPIDPNEPYKVGEEYGGVDFKGEARNARLFNVMLITLVVVVIGAIGYQLLTYGPGTVYAERDKQARQALRAQQEAERLAATEALEREAYRRTVFSADSLFAAGQYEAAAFYLRNAASIFPDSLSTKITLLEVYRANCTDYDRQCASAASLRAQLLSRPDVQNNPALRERVQQ